MHFINTLQLYFCAKLEQLILYLIHLSRNSSEVQLKIYLSLLDCAKMKLLQVYFRYTLNILHLNLILYSVHY